MSADNQQTNEEDFAGEVSLRVIEFCSIECELQVSGERSVSWMCQAWNWAQWEMTELTPKTIQTLGLLVEPVKNHRGFRQVGVRVGWDVKPEWEVVPGQIERLCEHGDDLTPAEWFRQYEEIHPFVDGNGRSGAIIFNWLGKTMHTPTWPPNFWDDHRRREGHGAG